MKGEVCRRRTTKAMAIVMATNTTVCNFENTGDRCFHLQDTQSHRVADFLKLPRGWGCGVRTMRHLRQRISSGHGQHRTE